jgi:hypothetical protein
LSNSYIRSTVQVYISICDELLARSLPLRMPQ